MVLVLHMCPSQGKKHRETLRGDKSVTDDERSALIEALDDLGWTLDKKSLGNKGRLMLANGETPREWKKFLSEAMEASHNPRLSVRVTCRQQMN